MDCDTTGVEPDFALVKFKKLSGGGYFKIINQSVPQALKNLGYTQAQNDAIVNFAVGHASFENAPHINNASLLAKGFTQEEIAKLNGAAKSAFEIGFIFNRFTLGDACLTRLGFKEEVFADWSFDLLEALGFNEDQIDEANDYVCGTMTVEGAPALNPAHLSIFDCANKNGKKGVRYIHAHGHIRMMAACQPFLSGAISKTINLPNDATVSEIADSYLMSWELGLKANAIYRDGSKLSQPLSTKSDKKKKTDGAEEDAHASEAGEKVELASSQMVDLSNLTVDELLEEVQKRMATSTDTVLKRQLSRIVERKSLPAKRRGFTQKARIGGQVLFLRTGEYNDGTVGELFIDLAKEGSTLRSLMNCFAISISVGLQYGVPLEEFVDKFVFTKFEPSGMVDHPNIKTTTSIVDFIFRALAYEYLGRTDLVHVLDKPTVENLGEAGDITLVGTPELSSIRVTAPATATAPAAKANVVAAVGESERPMDNVTAAAKGMQSDAPACSTCGHITIRSGTCYKCLNCGTSMGCS
jgi:ribonucleoside-diphosphate reductase alpha chain